MATPNAHLSLDNQKRSIQKFFADGFAFTECTWVPSYGNMVDMDNPVKEAGIAIYSNAITTDRFFTVFNVFTRINSDTKPDFDGGICARIIDKINVLFRSARGGISLYDFSNVKNPGDVPVLLTSGVVHINKLGVLGEPNRISGPYDEAGFWRMEVEHQFMIAYASAAPPSHF